MNLPDDRKIVDTNFLLFISSVVTFLFITEIMKLLIVVKGYSTYYRGRLLKKLDRKEERSRRVRWKIKNIFVDKDKETEEKSLIVRLIQVKPENHETSDK